MHKTFAALLTALLVLATSGNALAMGSHGPGFCPLPFDKGPGRYREHRPWHPRPYPQRGLPPAWVQQPQWAGHPRPQPRVWD
jgi:hypothetical protein